MAEFGPNMPMDIGDPARLWKGGVRTNGFLMGSVNSRVPALTEGLSSIALDLANPLYVQDVVTWGNGLWFDVNNADTKPGVRYGQAPVAPGKPLLFGLLKFNQGWQASNPVQPYGAPTCSTHTVIRKGLVGYETAMAAPAQASNYLKYLIGDAAQDIAAVRTLYDDWIAAWKAAAAGSKLALFIGDISGFPVVSVVLAANLSAPALAGCTFAGFAKVFAKEHGRIYFDVDLG
jgi:hypothetical protein